MIALIKNLTSKDPFYVRCIKPNEVKSPVIFDEERVTHQVRYLGLVENILVRRAGFAYRQRYDKFLKRFGIQMQTFLFYSYCQANLNNDVVKSQI